MIIVKPNEAKQTGWCETVYQMLNLIFRFAILQVKPPTPLHSTIIQIWPTCDEIL
jgi:hypothetical protein